jgi:hypothetical protein
MMLHTPSGCTTIKEKKFLKLFLFLIVSRPFGARNITTLCVDDVAKQQSSALRTGT